MLTIFVLKFITPRYTLLFSYSEIYKQMFSITNVVDPFNFFAAHIHISIEMVSERSSISNCITCFVCFGIRDYSFMLLEDYAFNFLHGCWNYVLIKTKIDDLILFNFEFKYVKLVLKAIASMEFSFVINLCQSCSYDACLFKKNRRKLP